MPKYPDHLKHLYDDCGHAYKLVCGETNGVKCTATCQAAQPTGKEEFEHFVCTKSGEWVSSANFPEDITQVSYDNPADFNCNYDLY